MEHDPTIDSAPSTAAIYMLRTTQQHHVQLSAMADLKANILITASSILLSVVIAITGTDGFRPSLGLLAAATVVGLFFAVLAVVPKFRRQTDAGNNPLFFGTFAHLAEDDFVDGMLELSHSTEEIIRAQSRDIHQLGVYLERSKYRYLRVAYIAFLVGLVGGGVLEVFHQFS